MVEDLAGVEFEAEASRAGTRTPCPLGLDVKLERWLGGLDGDDVDAPLRRSECLTDGIAMLTQVGGYRADDVILVQHLTGPQPTRSRCLSSRTLLCGREATTHTDFGDWTFFAGSLTEGAAPLAIKPESWIEGPRGVRDAIWPCRSVGGNIARPRFLDRGTDVFEIETTCVCDAQVLRDLADLDVYGDWHVAHGRNRGAAGMCEQ